MFIKYGANRNHSAWGHRGNLAYEAEVYPRVLRPLLEFRPRCLGAHTYPATGDTALFLEYADRCLPRNLHFRWLGATGKSREREESLALPATAFGGKNAGTHLRAGDLPSVRSPSSASMGWGERSDSSRPGAKEKSCRCAEQKERL